MSAIQSKSVKHEYEKHTFSKPTYCFACHQFLWGLRKQGLRCSLCGLPVHSECELKKPYGCEKKIKDWQPQIRQEKGKNREFVNTDSSHQFEVYSFKKPTWCDYCSKFIFGLRKQGYRCTSCAYNVHSDCLDGAKNQLNCGGLKS
mmetsp:Transcript_687/g.926  ORF Transcript_687/g.926 Transcript_687/m.926 type:complete len:145 (-) Transcript_687:14-448(-)